MALIFLAGTCSCNGGLRIVGSARACLSPDVQTAGMETELQKLSLGLMELKEVQQTQTRQVVEGEVNALRAQIAGVEVTLQRMTLEMQRKQEEQWHRQQESERLMTLERMRDEISQLRAEGHGKDEEVPLPPVQAPTAAACRSARF